MSCNPDPLSTHSKHVYNVYDQYQKKFNNISSKKQQTGFISFLRGIFSNSTHLRFAKNMTVEHLSHRSRGGTTVITALTKTKKILNEMKSHKMEKIIAGACDIEKNIFFSSKLCKKKAQELIIGESLAIPVSTSTHAMIMVIKCTGITDGKKKYEIEHHNTGAKISEYHYAKVNENGKLLYQTALRIIVSEENLFNKKSSFFDRVLEPGSFKKLYEEIIPLILFCQKKNS